MVIDLNSAVEFLRERDNFLILSHAHPDGDTLGSAFALKYALEAVGKRAEVKCCDTVPKKFDYLGKVCDTDYDYGTFVAVDVADTKLLGKDFEELYADKIELCIDHHGSNRMFAERTLLDAGAAAACEIILEIIHLLGVKPNKKIADCIYTGLTTDTGCFRYSNVTPRTMRMAAEMIECEADNVTINTVMFETKTRTYAALEKLAVAGMKMYLDGKCAVITVTQEMYRLSGSDESEVDAIASLPRQIEGVLVGVTLRERKDGSFKISMRSNRPINVSDICAAMGGGGHPQAAGCQVDGPLEAATETVVENVKNYIEKL